MKNKSISLIVTGFNIAEFVEQCLNSFLHVNSDLVEIIFVDDGSVDVTLDLVKDFSIKNSININIISKINGGVSSARNLGLKLSKNDYVAFIDGDDFIDFNELSKIINSNDFGISDVIFGNYFNYQDDFFNSKKNNTMKEYSCKNGLEVLIEYFLIDISPSVWKAVYKRKNLIQNNLYFLEDVPVAEDFEWLFRVLYTSEYVSTTNYYYYYYRLRQGSTMRSEFSYNKYCGVINVVKSLIDFLKNKDFNKKSHKLILNEKILAILVRGMSMYKGNKDVVEIDLVLKNFEVKKVKLKIFLKLIKIFPNVISKLLRNKYLND